MVLCFANTWVREEITSEQHPSQKEMPTFPQEEVELLTQVFSVQSSVRMSCIKA